MKFDKRFCIVLQIKIISKWQQEARIIENNESVLKVAPSKWILTTIKASIALEADIRWNIAIYRIKQFSDGNYLADNELEKATQLSSYI